MYSSQEQLYICQRNREMPRSCCYNNLDAAAFSELKTRIEEQYPNIEVLSKQCSGLCPLAEDDFVVRIGTMPRRARSFADVENIIKDYLRQNTHEKNRP